MNDKYSDFYKIYFGQKVSSLCLKDFRKSQYSFELESILKEYDLNQVVVLDQIHTDVGLCIDASNPWKKSSLLEHQGDFLITNQKGIGLIVLTADCVPLILVDSERQVVAIVHAGWKGSFLGVLEKTLEAMHLKYQSDYSNIQAVFGPSALGCCYEVSQDFVEKFENKFGKIDAFLQQGSLSYFNNNQFLQKILKKYGILEHNINIENSFCTICNLQYCSFRREGEQARRQITMVALR
ncbi:peptidoglycan editing factor PgeF [Candidatus Dependentiae bacterium]|nr:peptidoglycan editing factor PgeF [Candidatus Dependentiae bacterium]